MYFPASRIPWRRAPYFDDMTPQKAEHTDLDITPLHSNPGCRRAFQAVEVCACCLISRLIEPRRCSCRPWAKPDALRIGQTRYNVTRRHQSASFSQPVPFPSLRLHSIWSPLVLSRPHDMTDTYLGLLSSKIALLRAARARSTRTLQIPRYSAGTTQTTRVLLRNRPTDRDPDSYVSRTRIC